MRKLFLAVLYISFAVMLTAVLLVVRFPKDSFLTYITSKIEGSMPGYQCNISDIGYHYPASVELGTVTFQKGENGREQVMENVSVRFDPKVFLKQFLVEFSMFGGSVSLEGEVEDGWRDVLLNGIEISGMDLQKADLGYYFQRDVSGILRFSGNYTGSVREIEKGRLNGTVELSGFVSELKRPVLMSSNVSFDLISARIELDNGQLIFSDGSAKGQMYDGTFSGQVMFGPNPSGGSLVIDGTLSPKQEFVRKNRKAARAAALLYKKYRDTNIPFNVTGRPQEPVFRFGSRPQQRTTN